MIFGTGDCKRIPNTKISPPSYTIATQMLLPTEFSHSSEPLHLLYCTRPTSWVDAPRRGTKPVDISFDFDAKSD